MFKRKKKETLADVEKEVMGDFPDTDKDENKDVDKNSRSKRQDEFPGMPEKTPFGKQAETCGNMWEDVQIMKKALKKECEKLLPLMKEIKKSRLIITSESGEKLMIEITVGNERIKIGKRTEVNL